MSVNLSPGFVSYTINQNTGPRRRTRSAIILERRCIHSRPRAGYSESAEEIRLPLDAQHELPTSTVYNVFKLTSENKNKEHNKKTRKDVT